MEKEDNAEPQPSSSTAAPMGAIETIESFARANNLTLVNIQNMIYHIITDTDLFTTLVGSNKQALPHLRLTRSKWKEIKQKVDRNVDICLNPVEAPRTFLDVEYNENDEDDDPEYIPENVHENEADYQYYMDETFEDPSYEPLFFSNIDQEYAQFVNSLNAEIPAEMDDEDDPEYLDPINNEMSEAEEEFIYDRTTEISKREMQDLWKAFDINIDVEMDRCRSSLNQPSQQLKTPTKTFVSVPDNSTLLLGKKPLKFTSEQKNLVEEQLAQHLQLLVQSIACCHGKENLADSYYSCITMLNELATLMEDFNVKADMKFPDINSALQLATDLFDEKPEVMKPPLCESAKGQKNNESYYVQWALATSDVIMYPELLPSFNCDGIPEKKSAFSPSERALLTLGLITFKNVPLASANNTYGRYQYISRYFLPSRTSNQMRVHVLHTRQRYSDSFSKVMTAAFQGAWIVDTRLLMKRFKSQPTRPVDWPVEFQLPWLRKISKFRQHFDSGDEKYSVFSAKNNILQQKLEGSKIISCVHLPDNYEIVDLNSRILKPKITEESEKNLRTSVDDEAEESRQSGKSGGDSTTKNADQICESSIRLSSKQRRYDNLIKTLNAAENKEKSFTGIVAAIQADINKQFFMHEEKLRQFRKIISTPGQNPAEVIEELKVLLDEKDHEIIFLLATLLDPSNFDDSFCDSAEYRAIQGAVEMLKGIQTYLYISRGLKTVRKLGTWFRNQSSDDIQKLQGILKTLFRRDQKIYRLFVADDYEAKIPDDRFETVDLSKAVENQKPSENFEVVEIPYKRPRLCIDRPQPQLHHGNIIFEKNGSETALEIRSSNDRIINWGIAADLDLLKMLIHFGTDFEKAAQEFCKKPLYNYISPDEAKARLNFLKSSSD